MIYITFILIIPFLSSIVAFFFEWIEREVAFVSTIISTYISFVLYYKYRYLNTVSFYYFIFNPKVLFFMFIFNLVFAVLIILSFKLMRKHPYSNRFYFNVLLILVFLNFLYLSNITIFSIFVPLIIGTTIFLSGWKGKSRFLIKESVAWLFLFFTLFLKEQVLTSIMVFIYAFITLLPVSIRLRNKTPIIYGFIRFAQLFSIIYWIIHFRINYNFLFFIFFFLLVIVYIVYLFKDSRIWKVFEINFLAVTLPLFYIVLLNNFVEVTILGLVLWLLTVLTVLVSLYYKYYSDGKKILVNVSSNFPIFFFLIFLEFFYLLPIPGSIVRIEGDPGIIFFSLQLLLTIVSLFTLFYFMRTEQKVKVETSIPFLLKLMPFVIGLLVVSNGINILWGRIKWAGLIPVSILFFYLILMFAIKTIFNLRIISSKRNE